MTAAISDPYHLATYSVSTGGPRTTSSVFSSFTALPDSTNGWITLTVQGDGIHIMDLVSSQPIASHTLGSSSFFSAPAITTIRSADGTAMRRRTYAPVAPNESSSQNPSHEIWIWEDDFSESLISSVPEKHTLKLSHDVVSLLPCSAGDIVIAVSHEGHMSSVGRLEEGIVSALQATSSLQEHVLKSWVLPRHECGFSTTFAAPNSSITVRLMQGEDRSLFLCLDACDTAGIIVAGLRIPVPSQTSATIDATFSPNGGFSCLTSSGSWIYYQLGPEALGPNGMELRPYGSPLTPLPNSKISLTGASLISLTSSHVLLSSTSTTVSNERAGKLALELQIWDLKYCVLLASFSAGLPSAGSVSEDSDRNILLFPQLRLTDTAMGYAILTISSSSGTALQLSVGEQTPDVKKKRSNVKKGRSVEAAGPKKRSNANVLVVPYHVPKSSTLAAAVLSRSVDISEVVPFTSEHCADSDASARKRQRTIAETLRKIVQESEHSPGAALDTFWKWIDAESIIEQDANAVEKRKTTRPNRDKVDLPHQFVAELVSILADAPSSSWATLRPIMEYLLARRHAVVNGMLCRSSARAGNLGVVQMLAERGDWALVKLSLFVLPDIPDEEIVRLLRIVVDSHLGHNAMEASQGATPSNTATESMNIAAGVQHPATQDHIPAKPTRPAWNNIPNIRDFLPAVLGYPLSGTLLRQAIRRHFADIEALLPVLRRIIKFMEESPVFDWMKAGQSIRVDRYGKVLRNQLHERNGRKQVGKQGVAFWVLRTQAGYPPLESILSFLEAVMDALFLPLMQHPEGKDLITHLGRILKPEVELTFHLGSMSALLEPFTKRQLPQDSGDVEGDKNTNPKAQESVARRNARDNTAIVKVYQVEELEL